jgi:hypothetical protein
MAGAVGFMDHRPVYGSLEEGCQHADAAEINNGINSRPGDLFTSASLNKHAPRNR